MGNNNSYARVRACFSVHKRIRSIVFGGSRVIVLFVRLSVTSYRWLSSSHYGRGVFFFIIYHCRVRNTVAESTYGYDLLYGRSIELIIMRKKSNNNRSINQRVTAIAYDVMNMSFVIPLSIRVLISCYVPVQWIHRIVIDVIVVRTFDLCAGFFFYFFFSHPHCGLALLLHNITGTVLLVRTKSIIPNTRTTLARVFRMRIRSSDLVKHENLITFSGTRRRASDQWAMSNTIGFCE